MSDIPSIPEGFFSGGGNLTTKEGLAQLVRLIRQDLSTLTIDPLGIDILRPYTNVTRPSPGVEGRVIFNSDDKAPNFDDGIAWRDAMGELT